MNDPWFRMHANIGSKRVVWRLMETTGASKLRAVGALAMFWGAVSLYCPGGNIADVPDSQLEEWAAWDGKRGAFAAFVRGQHSTDGVINDYEEYCGALEIYRKKVRDRVHKLRASRDESALHDATSNRSVTVTKALPSSTGQDVESTKQQKQKATTSAASRRLPKADAGKQPSEKAKFPHYPTELCQRLHAKWEAKIGLIPYPMFRTRTAEAFNRPGFAESEPPEVWEETLSLFSIYRDIEPERERKWFTPERWWGDLPRLISLAHMPMTEGGIPTEKGMLALT